MLRKISLWLSVILCVLLLVACDIAKDDAAQNTAEATTATDRGTRDTAHDEVDSEKTDFEETTTEGVTTEGVTTEETTIEETTIEESTTEETTTEGVTTEESTTEETTTEETDPGEENTPTKPEVSFVFQMTENDLEEFQALCATLETLAVDGADTETLTDAFYELWDRYEYISTQEMVAYVNYYADLSSIEATENYAFADQVSSEASQVFNDMLAAIAASECAFCDILFEGWSDEEIAALNVDNETISTLIQANTALTMEYLSLPKDDSWSAEVDRIYQQFVANNNAIAAEYGYASYYDYASEQIYGRDYTAEQRVAFRQYVKDYIVPLCEEVSLRYMDMINSLTEEQFYEFYALVVSDYDSDEWETDYVRQYMMTFDETMYGRMSGTLDERVSIFTDSETAYGGAFTAYMAYFGKPIAYFGPGYQDLMTVVHESGHYAAFTVMESSTLCLDLCETHSQANEWLFLSYLQQQDIDPAVCEILKLYHLYDALESIIYSTVVDECEEIIYGAASQLSPDLYDEKLTAVKMSYGAYVSECCSTEYYFKCVAVQAPVYYISYATSQLASMSLYTVAATDYGAAQDMYVTLIEYAAVGDGFVGSLYAAGFPDPFDAMTFVSLQEVFGTADQQTYELAA